MRNGEGVTLSTFWFFWFTHLGEGITILTLKQTNFLVKNIHGTGEDFWGIYFDNFAKFFDKNDHFLAKSVKIINFLAICS